MYQVLYRKYRPKVFGDVVGQDHITSTLQNEIKSGRHSHAYLFTGSRGTGKTTCARIFAKAVNCLHPVDGNPCNECEICRGIESGAILDIVEIDAASNNGVDNIRDIREEVNFAPASCKYRVYIIDEVHMLSGGAFNALLKTLEEPPEHVKFILATTEVQKMPVTILSRCQRFDFKRVSAESMKKRIDFIAEEENFTVDDEAARLIARLADGGMRDALSMLDRCIGKSSEVTVDIVSAVAGLAGREHLFSIASAVAGSDASKALRLINDLYSNSFDMERLCSELIAHFRALMIVKTVRGAENVLVTTSEELEEYRAQSREFSLEALLLAIDTFQSALASIKQGVNRRTELELAVIRLCVPEAGSDVAALAQRVAELERRLLSFGEKPVATKPEPRKTEKPVEALSGSTDKAPAQTEQKPEVVSQFEDEPVADGDFSEWGKVVEHIKNTNKPLWSMLVGTGAYIAGGCIYITGEDPAALAEMLKRDKNTREVLIASFETTGKRIRRLAVDRSGAGAPSNVPKEDTLGCFLEKARELGVDVSIE